jgi:TPR repeat protein
MRRVLLIVMVAAGLMENLFSGVLDGYVQICSGGDSKGCYQLAIAYRDGHGVGQDAEAARQFFQIACDMGHTQACSDLNDQKGLPSYYPSINTDPDEGRKRENEIEADFKKPSLMNVTVYKNACRESDMQACYMVGLAYLTGDGVKKNLELGKSFLKMSCEAGINMACYYLYRKEDSTKARDYAIAACNHKIAEGCGKLGYIYDEGLGVKADPEKSKAYYKKMIDYGRGICDNKKANDDCSEIECLTIAENCNLVGLGYGNGLGVEKNPPRSDQYYTKSCLFGGAEGCMVAGTGFLLQKDVNNAEKYLKRSCGLGDTLGCLTLAQEYDMPAYGFSVNKLKAKEYYQKMCDLGGDSGCDSAMKIDLEKNPVLLLPPDDFMEDIADLNPLLDIAYLNPFALYKKECERGNMDGCVGVGACYIYGEGTTQNYKKAKIYFDLACKLNIAKGCYGAGLAYEKMHRADKAISQYSHSCKMGFKLGCRWANKLKKDR